MTKRIVLLRAVNVAGRKLSMAELQGALRGVGCGSARTHGASGNAVVEAEPRVPNEQLERSLEAALATRTGLRTEVFVRYSSEWEVVVLSNPFRREAHADPAHLVLTVLSSAPSATAWRDLERAVVGRERIVPGERHAYIVYPDGIGRSKLTPSVIERTLGVRGTSRNWNTVLSLLTLSRDSRE